MLAGPDLDPFYRLHFPLLDSTDKHPEPVLHPRSGEGSD